jgi:hypothetical protein
MNSGERKYGEVMDLLRKSKPVMNDQATFTEKVLQEIKRGKPSVNIPALLNDYLFGWAYIGWVRRSLVAVSFAILLVFIYQQSVILRRINAIDRQVIFTRSQLVPGINDRVDTRLLFQRAKYNLPVNKGTLTGKQVDELIESFNELQGKYMDILRLIKEDPELKDYIEKKLDQNGRKKLNL